jgi:HK97 family phage portal protein
MLLFGRNFVTRSERREVESLKTTAKAYVGPTDVLGLSGPGGGGWYGIGGVVREPFSGAWQRNIALDTRGCTAFSAVYACVSLRARDIGKLRIKLMEQSATGIWSEVRGNASPFLKVLRKPNRYQTRIQFLEYWMASKLLYGNAYVLKERDERGVVVALYVLDPRRVTPKVATDGSVWYDCGNDYLTGIGVPDVFPASEIIHDRCVTLFHPLVGVSPIYAAGMSAAQGVKIQENSAAFFGNMSLPSGQLTAPAKIDDITAARLKRDFEAAVGGVNIGRIFVAGDGLKYEGFTMPAVDAQLIEQLRWTVEDVARCFGVPLHKIMAGAVPQVGNMAALDQAYYGQTLQEDIESIELLLDEGLRLDKTIDGKTYGTELDLEGLLRMDPVARAERLQKLAGVMKVDEMRASENLDSTEGGDAVYLQQQNFSTAALAKRDAQEDPFKASGAGAQAPAPEPAATSEPAPEAANDKAAELASVLMAKFLKESDGVAA